LALTISPQRKRLGLYFDIVDHNIVTNDFVEFVASVLRRLGQPITLVLDRWQVHRSGVRKIKARFGHRVYIEWLPAYAPELNPTEHVWGHTKYVDLQTSYPTTYSISDKPSSARSETRVETKLCCVPSSITLNSKSDSLSSPVKVQ